MTENISKIFEGEWTISTPADPASFKNVATPIFSPLSGCSVAFCFEAWYQQIPYDDDDNDIYLSLSLFKLKLIKLSGACISPTLNVTVDVLIFYSDGSLFEEYLAQPTVNVDDMDEVTFPDVISTVTDTDECNTDHGTKMLSNTLIIKCKMTFNDCNQTSHIKSGVEMKSSNKYLDLMRNFKSMYEPSVLNDFVFKVGDKSFPAHKFVLAAHSPVFKNMMTHEFLESKTNSVTITDANPEIFDLFLRYLYSGEIEDKSWESLKELYYLADKYDVEILKNECTDAAISLLSLDLICDILKLAYLYSNPVLKSTAITFTVKHMKEIFPREDWKELVAVNSVIGYEVAVHFIPK